MDNKEIKEIEEILDGNTIFLETEPSYVSVKSASRELYLFMLTKQKEMLEGLKNDFMKSKVDVVLLHIQMKIEDLDSKIKELQ